MGGGRDKGQDGEDEEEDGEVAEEGREDETNRADGGQNRAAVQEAAGQAVGAAVPMHGGDGYTH